MAENIGKVVVSIEAEVQELRAGLELAEKMFKKSAEDMATQQKKLGKKFKKSWTELSSKVNMLTMALGAAEKAVGVFGEAMVIVGDDSLTSWEKVGGVIESIGNSGIPVVSQMVGLSTELAKVAVGYNAEMASIQKIHEDIARINAFGQIKGQIVGARLALEAQLKLQKFVTEVTEKRAKGESSVTAEFQIQRTALEANFAQEKTLLKERMTKNKESLKDITHALGEQQKTQNDILSELDIRETLAHEQWKSMQEEKTRLEQERADEDKRRLEEKTQREKEAIERIEKAELARIEREKNAEEAAAQAVANKTLDLQTQLEIMIAEQAGDEEKARILAINARYNKMKQGASEAQRLIIEQMQQIEMSASKTAEAVAPTSAVVGGGESGGGAGGTAGISTAIGGFTVATGGGGEQKKQTSLLKAIADSNEEVAKAIKKGASSGGILVAA